MICVVSTSKRIRSVITRLYCSTGVGVKNVILKSWLTNRDFLMWLPANQKRHLKIVVIYPCFYPRIALVALTPDMRKAFLSIDSSYCLQNVLTTTYFYTLSNDTQITFCRSENDFNTNTSYEICVFTPMNGTLLPVTFV